MGKGFKVPSMSDVVHTEQAEALIGSDLQSQRLVELSGEMAASRALLLNEVLFDLSDAQKRDLIDDLVERHASIVDHWRKAGKHYLGAGRALLAISKKLPQASLDRLLNSFDRNQEQGVANESALPFGRTTAHRLMAVARMVEERRFHIAFENAGRTFEEDMLPPYTIAAVYAPLDDDHLTEAVKSNLLRPDVKHAEAAKFVASLKAPSAPSRISLQRELKKIDDKLRKLYEQAAALEADKRRLLGEAGIEVRTVPSKERDFPATPVGEGGGGQVPAPPSQNQDEASRIAA